MVYILVILNGVTMVSAEAVPADKCAALQRYNPGMLCIEATECGRAEGLTRCPDDPLPRKRYVARARR